MLDVQVIDIFSGCGGMSYGFAAYKSKTARFRIVGALDNDQYANATYHRMLGVSPIELDFSTLKTRDDHIALAKRWNIDPKKPLVLIGCAPCQGFSSHRKKDHRNDTRNSLIEVLADFVTYLRPDLFIMENVPELFHTKFWRHYAAAKSILESSGYHVQGRLFNLAQFGVPQERFRAFVMATPVGKGIPMPLPQFRPSQFKTVRMAIGALPPLEAGQVDPDDPMHRTSAHRKSTVEMLRMIPHDGGSNRDLPPGVGPQCFRNVDGFRDVYGRLWWDKPAVSITARCRTPSCGRYVHPEQPRGLSVREAALLQGFPKTYQFEGPFDDMFKQIGNAVSPVFSCAVAKHIAYKLPHSLAGTSNSLPDAYDINRPITHSISSMLASVKRRMHLTDSDFVSLDPDQETS